MNSISNWDQKNGAELICKNCGSQKFKNREELNEDEALLVKRLSTNLGFLAEQSGGDLFCQRCLYQFVVDRPDRFTDQA